MILTKLAQLHAPKLRTVMVDLWRAEHKDPQDVTAFEPKVILEYMGGERRESSGRAATDRPALVEPERERTRI